MEKALTSASARKVTRTWSCDECRDNGYTQGSVSYQAYGSSDRYFCSQCSKGRDLFQKWKAAPQQQEHFRVWKQEKIANTMRLSGVGHHFKSKRLSDLDDTPNLQQECQNYVKKWKDMKAKGFGFFFWGNIGAGKTHTACALANELMEQELVEVLFLNMPSAVDRIKKTFDSTVRTKDHKLLDRMKEVELLVLDDLGVEKSSDWLRDQLYQIVDHRWQSHLPMIITSNQSLEDLEKHYLPQITSRIWSCCKSLHFSDEDRRKSLTLF